MSETQTLTVTQKKLPASQLGLEIEIPGERSQKAYESVITKLMRTAQIPGFRRGKVPRQVILQRFGSGYLKAATLEDLVQNALQEAIKQEDLTILGNLELQSSFEELVDQFKPGDSITFSASADIHPEISLKRHSGFELSVEESLYNPERINETLQQQQSAHATLVPVDDRPAQMDDVVMVDFISEFPDDSEAGEDSGSEMTDFQVELSESRFLPGFVQGVIGMKIDEHKEFEVEFPEDYFEQSLAGRTATFKVTLKDIKSKELPELTDDFAQEISEFETLDGLKTFLEEQYQKEAQTETENRTHEAIMDALVEELEVDLPQTLIEQEVNAMLNEMAARFQSQGMDINKLFTKESIPGFKERLKPEAEKRVKRTLALAEVAKQEKLEVDLEALEEKFTATLKQLDERKIDRDRLRQVLADELLETQVLDWVKEHSTITCHPPQESAPAEATPSEAASEEAASEEPAAQEKSPPAKKPPSKAPKAKAATQAKSPKAKSAEVKSTQAEDSEQPAADDDQPKASPKASAKAKKES